MYFTFQVPDDAPAKTFYGAVLGWEFTPGSRRRRGASRATACRAASGAARAVRSAGS